jgi:hypothetical protein
MGRALGLSVAGIMVLLGGLWFGQGNGWIGGSSMTGESFWAYAGAITAGLGIALAIVVVQAARRGDAGEMDQRYGGRR